MQQKKRPLRIELKVKKIRIKVLISINVYVILGIRKPQDKGGYTFHMCKYWRALALLVNEMGGYL